VVEGVSLNGIVDLDHNRAIVGRRHMAISLNEIAQQSGAALDQIRSYPINWSLASIAIAVVGCWLLAEVHRVF
jgi:hypothetical protein